MARALFTDGVSGLSGSINKKAGGATYQKNGVKRVRNGSPNNPRTASQTLRRTLFNALTTAWGGLTEAQRDAWEQARTGNVYYLKTDPLTGVQRPYASAKDLYIAMNTNLNISRGENNAAPQITAPGVAEGFYPMIATAVTADNSANTVVMAYTGGVPDKNNLVVKATPCVPAGTMRVKSVQSQMRVVYVADGGGGNIPATPINLDGGGPGYTTLFGAVGAVGTKIFWQAELVDNGTGKSVIVGTGVAIVQA